MKGKMILLAVAGTLALQGCSSLNPWNDSRLTKMEQLDPKDALKVPKYMLEAQPNNVGVGEGRATDPQSSRDFAMHFASLDLCKKLNVNANSTTTTTAAQNSKGGRSQTALTGTIRGETACKAAVGTPEILDIQTASVKGVEYVTWVKLQSDNVTEILENKFDETDQRVADNIKRSQ